MRSAKYKLTWMGVVALALVAGCDAGSVKVQFEWPEGRPTFPPDSPASVFIRVEERADVQVPGPVLVQLPPYAFSQERATIPIIPYGDDHVFVAELRESASPESQVLYYGLSEKFSIHQGEDIVVPVFMQPTRPPQVVTVGSATISASLRVMTSTDAPGFVRSPTVTLALITDSGATVRVSNVLGLPEGRSVVQVLGDLDLLPDVPAGRRGYSMAWSLDRGAVPCANLDYCPRQVFARFIDAQGYPSRPVAAEVVVDGVPPTVIPGASSVTPSAARGDSRIVVALTTSETLRRTPVVQVAEVPTFSLVRAFPEAEGPSNVFTFVATQPASVLGSGGTFHLRATMVDLAGNVTSDERVGAFTVDTPPPGLGALTVEPSRVAVEAGKVVIVRFTLDDVLVGGRFAVSVGGRDVATCTRSGATPSITVECTLTLWGDEIPEGSETVEPVLVSAVDEAGNAAEASTSVVFDRKPPRLADALFAPTVAREGRSVLLSLTADERLTPAHPPRLVWSGGRDLGLSFVSVSGLNYNYRRDIDSSVPDGTYRIERIVLEDLAGLTATVTPAAPLVVTVDKRPPAISAFRVAPLVIGKTGRVTATFRLNEAPGTDGLQVVFGSRPMTCTSSGAAPVQSMSCTWAMQGNEIAADTEATELVIVDLVDAAGNASRVSERLRVDFRAPMVVARSEVLTFEPAQDSVLYRIPGRPASIDALGLGATAVLSFALDETPRVMPTVQTRSPGVLSFVPRSTAVGRSLTYALTLASAPAQGEYTLEVVVEDALRNRATRAITIGTPNPKLVIDSIAPSAPRADQFVHERYPWGGQAVGTGAHANLVAPARSAEAEGLLVVLAEPSLRTSAVIGYADVDAQGGVSRFTLLNAIDRREVYVAVVDGAGNVSPSSSGRAGEASRVRHGVWTATLWDQDNGLLRRNPHRAKVLSFIEPVLDQGIDGAREATPEEYADLGTVDGRAVSVQSLRRWEAMTPPFGTPTARAGAAMAYDRMRGRAVMFGGVDAAGPRRDTWELDGRNWVQVNSSNGRIPQAREQAALAYDAVHGKVVLFGGRSGTTSLADTWLWDGRDWVDVTATAGSPPARWGHNLVYDEARGQVVLFGGASTTLRSLGDTWIWNGSAWVGRPGAGPPARYEGAMAGSAADGILLTGGLTKPDGGVLISDAWAFDGTTWSPTGRVLPPSRHGANLAFDPGLTWTLVFGSTSNDISPTSEVSVRATTGSWLSIIPTGNRPPPRMRAAMTYDLRRGSLIVFGGLRLGSSGSVEYLADTWAWERGRAWRELTPGTDWPSSRVAQAAAYDPVRREVVMFGGETSGSVVSPPGDGGLPIDAGSAGPNPPLGDTWAWNGSRFRLILPGAAPSPRSGAAMASSRTGVVLFGGEKFGEVIEESGGTINPPQTWRLSQTWSWNGVTWLRPTNNVDLDGEPGSRSGHTLIYDPLRDMLVLFGGGTRGVSFVPPSVSERSADTRWRTLAAQGPQSRRFHSMAFDAVNGRGLVFGGRAANAAPLADFWSWKGPVNSAAQGSWARIAEQPSWPAARIMSALSYDAARDRVVLDAGWNGQGTQFEDSWEWNGTTWSAIETGSHKPSSRSQHSLVYDPDRRRHVLLARGSVGLDLWELHADPDQRPGVAVSFDLAASLVSSAEVQSISLEATAGARGYTVVLGGVGVPSPGASLSLWNARIGSWSQVASNGADIGGLQALSAAPAAIGDPKALFEARGRVELLLAPSAGLGNGATLPEIGLDGIELKATYLLAP